MTLPAPTPPPADRPAGPASTPHARARSSVHVIRGAERAAALLPPLRRRILEALREPDSSTGVARRLELPRQRVNYHVRALEREGLLEEVGRQRKGNCTERLVRATARHYLIAPQALGELAADPESVADHFSSAYLVAVAAAAIRDLTVAQETDGAPRRTPTLTLQTEIRFASSETRGAFAEELAGALAELVKKYHDEQAPGGRPFRLFLGAYPAPSADSGATSET